MLDDLTISGLTFTDLNLAGVTRVELDNVV